jgi:acyl-CoA thioester hydrolase
MTPMIAAQSGKSDGLSGDSMQTMSAGDAGSGSFDGATHIFPLRVYYEDTDAAGIVYYANYLKFAERARTELMRLLGAEHRTMMAQDGVGFAVRACTAEYLLPARLDDALAVHTQVTAVGGASLAMTQTVMRPDAGGGATPLVALTVRLACIDGGQRAARLPQAVRAALRRLMESAERDAPDDAGVVTG